MSKHTYSFTLGVSERDQAADVIRDLVDSGKVPRGVTWYEVSQFELFTDGSITYTAEWRDPQPRSFASGGYVGGPVPVVRGNGPECLLRVVVCANPRTGKWCLTYPGRGCQHCPDDSPTVRLQEEH